MLSKRQINIIKCIIKNPQGIYASTMCEELNVSTRTIRNDIASINAYLMNNHCMINSSKKTGYFIVSESIDRIKECLHLLEAINHKQIASSPKERRYYLLGRLLFDENVNLCELADELYVTETTIYKDANSLIRILSEKYYFEGVKLFNNTLMLKASEEAIRSLVYRIVKEEVTISNKLMNMHLYQLIKEVLDYEELNDIVEYIAGYCDIHQLGVSDPIIYCVAWLIYFTMIRIDCDNLLQPTQVQLDQEENWLMHVSNDLQLGFEPYDCFLLESFIESLGIRMSNTSEENDDDMIQDFLLEAYDKFNLDLMGLPSLTKSLTQHLKYAVKRLLMDYQLVNPMLQEVKTKYTFAYEIALLIVPIVHKKFDKFFNEDEVSFLALYIQPFLQIADSQVNILIVNEATMSYVHLIENWLNREFGNKIKVVGYSSVHLLEEAIYQKKANLVVSTTLLENKLSVPVINIFRLPTENDRNEIEHFISSHAMRYQGAEIFNSVFHPLNIVIFENEINFEEAIMQCALKLEENGAINQVEEFAMGCIEREKIYSTHIAHACFMPHPLINTANHNAICVALLKNGCEIYNQNATVLFVSAFEPRLNKDLQLIYKLISTIAESSSLMQVLLECDTAQEVLDYLEHMMQMI